MTQTLSIRSRAALAGLVLALTGCATLAPDLQQTLCEPISVALETAPSMLKLQADSDNKPAQYSYAIVLKYGLNGVPADPVLAETYRQKAIAPISNQMMSIYVPAAGKVPGHMMFINQPVYAKGTPSSSVIEACLAVLATDAPDAQASEQMNKGVCGGAQNYQRLKNAWQLALHRQLR